MALQENQHPLLQIMTDREKGIRMLALKMAKEARLQREKEESLKNEGMKIYYNENFPDLSPVMAGKKPEVIDDLLIEYRITELVEKAIIEGDNPYRITEDRMPTDIWASNPQELVQEIMEQDATVHLIQDLREGGEILEADKEIQGVYENISLYTFLTILMGMEECR